MSEVLLNEEGWEALANLRLKRLNEVNAENEQLRLRISQLEEQLDYVEGIGMDGNLMS